MIFFWGIENFGIWVFLISIPNIIQIFNFNLTDASVNQMAIYNAEKNKKSNEIFQNTILFVIINIIILSVTILTFFY